MLRDAAAGQGREGAGRSIPSGGSARHPKGRVGVTSSREGDSRNSPAADLSGFCEQTLPKSSCNTTCPPWGLTFPRSTDPSAAGTLGCDGKHGGEIIPSLGGTKMWCQESVLSAVPGKLSRFLGTLITLPPLFLPKTCYSTQHLFGALGSAFATKRVSTWGCNTAPRPERKPAEYAQQITQQGLGGSHGAGGCRAQGTFLLTLKTLLLQCNRWKRRIFYESARAVTGRARRLLLRALRRRRQARGSTLSAPATPCSALPGARMGVPKGTGCSRCRYSSPSPPKGVAFLLMSAFRNKGYVCSARKSRALQKLAASPRTLLSFVRNGVGCFFLTKTICRNGPCAAGEQNTPTRLCNALSSGSRAGLNFFSKQFFECEKESHKGLRGRARCKFLLYFHCFYFVRGKRAQKIHRQQPQFTSSHYDSSPGTDVLADIRIQPDAGRILPSSLSGTQRLALCRAADGAGHCGCRGVPSRGQQWQGGAQLSGGFFGVPPSTMGTCFFI